MSNCPARLAFTNVYMVNSIKLNSMLDFCVQCLHYDTCIICYISGHSTHCLVSVGQSIKLHNVLSVPTRLTLLLDQ